MPTDTSKQPQQILELPPGIKTLDQLVELTNDRVRQVNLAMQRFVQNPALGAVDLGQFKIINLADPKDELDGVNLRTLKKFAGGAAEESVATGDGLEEPTIYFAFDGLPFNAEASPYAQIMANRAGFKPTAASVCAVGAPSGDCSVNLTIGGVNMLAADLVLPAGQNGPVFTSAFALAGSLPLGTLIQGLIVQSGGASQITIALALKGS